MFSVEPVQRTCTHKHAHSKPVPGSEEKGGGGGGGGGGGRKEVKEEEEEEVFELTGDVE